MKRLVSALAERMIVFHARPAHLRFVIEKWHWNRGFVKYFSFSLSVYFQKYPMLIHSPTTNNTSNNNSQVSLIPVLKALTVIPWSSSCTERLCFQGFKLIPVRICETRLGKVDFFLFVRQINFHPVMFARCINVRFLSDYFAYFSALEMWTN